MLLPLAIDLLKRAELKQAGVRIRTIVIEQIYQLSLTAPNVKELNSLNCEIETDHLGLIHACQQPEGKLVVLCLDQRKQYRYHYCGVDTADTLRRSSVRTISMQHGGSSDNCIEDLASAASDVMLVWGEKTYNELVQRHGVQPERTKLVGNPLHDGLSRLNRDEVLKKLFLRYPQLEAQFATKRVALLATRLHSDYRDFPNELEMYDTYMAHLYKSLDVSQIFLIIKMHPLDSLEPNLYLRTVPNDNVKNSMLIFDPFDELDVYSLLPLADFVVTRASTVGEEALVLGRRVIAFDLLPEGPSKHHKHLTEYGNFSLVYANPENDLRAALSSAASYPRELSPRVSSVVEKDLTYRLDGQSTQRAADAILAQLFGASSHTIGDA